jgi:hypothetical protein
MTANLDNYDLTVRSRGSAHARYKKCAGKLCLTTSLTSYFSQQLNVLTLDLGRCILIVLDANQCRGEFCDESVTNQFILQHVRLFPGWQSSQCQGHSGPFTVWNSACELPEYA